MTTIFKFKEQVTCAKLRQDGNLLLTGEQSGKVQLFEIKNRFLLKTYYDSKK